MKPYRTAALLALSSMTLGCAATNRASGTIAGRWFEAEVIEAKYCAHCGGGVEVSVAFRSPLGAATTGLLELSTKTCVSERKLKIGSRGSGQAELSFSDDQRGGDSSDAVAGELEIDECTTSYLDAIFWGKFADGSRVSGSISTKLAYDAGYD